MVILTGMTMFIYRKFERTIRDDNKIFTLAHTETNTFSPSQTGFQAFTENLIVMEMPLKPPIAAHVIVCPAGRSERLSVVESLCVVASLAAEPPAPFTNISAKQFLEDLQAVMPVDRVMFVLHGACVADGYDDAEADLISHIRGLVGAHSSDSASSWDLH